MTDISAYQGISIIVADDPAYDGWRIDLWLFDVGGGAAGFLAFQCVDGDEQIRVVSEVAEDGFGPVNDYKITDTQARQVIEMFRREPDSRVIKGIATLRGDGVVGFVKAGAQPNIIAAQRRQRRR